MFGLPDGQCGNLKRSGALSLALGFLFSLLFLFIF